MKNGFQSYLKNNAGNTTLIFALCLLPILAGIGMALDLSRAQSSKTSIQNAIDAAVLASSRDLVNATLSDAQVIQRAKDYFLEDVKLSSTGTSCDEPTITLDRANHALDIAVNCSLPTTIAGLTGIDKFDFSETAQAKAAVTFLDVALVLDVSGSMAGTKLADLKVAAQDALDILITPESGDRVRMSIVPYSSSVNVDPFADDVFDYHDRHEWCVSERAGSLAYAETQPGGHNDFPSLATECPAQFVTPLTYNKTTLTNQINALTASGGTAGHLGAAWGWYTISPLWTSVWSTSSLGHDYDMPYLTKAVILMTDGEFNTQYDNTVGTSNEQAEGICDAMKAENIQVFSVAFQAPPAGETILQTCASSTDHYYNATSSTELKEAYRSIASQLTGLALTN